MLNIRMKIAFFILRMAVKIHLVKYDQQSNQTLIFANSRNFILYIFFSLISFVCVCVYAYLNHHSSVRRYCYLLSKVYLSMSTEAFFCHWFLDQLINMTPFSLLLLKKETLYLMTNTMRSRGAHHDWKSACVAAVVKSCRRCYGNTKDVL
jgi:hypothetical protein